MRIGDVLPTEMCPRCNQPARYLQYATLHNGSRWVTVKACLDCIGPAELPEGLGRYRRESVTLDKMLGRRGTYR